MLTDQWVLQTNLIIYLQSKREGQIWKSHMIAIRGCAALQGRFWKVSFPKIGCDFVKFPKIGYVFWVRTALGAQNYEIFPEKGYVFGVLTASGAWDCEISLK